MVVLSEIARIAVNATANATVAVNASANATVAVTATVNDTLYVDGLAYSRECEESFLQLLAGPTTLCGVEKLHAVVLFGGLCLTLVVMLCAFAFFREDKEEQITPLCPQLVVRDSDLAFKMPFDEQVEQMKVTNLKGEVIGKVVLDWPDLFRPGSCGVAATARLQNTNDCTLATVVARNVSGPGIALCRAGCEIFGFVEAEDRCRYNVRHRTGVHLLTLTGDFDKVDVEGINPVGSKVCWFKKVGLECRGRVLQHVDAGLVICSLMAVHLHRRLQAGAMSVPASPARITNGAPPPGQSQRSSKEPKAAGSPEKAEGKQSEATVAGAAANLPQQASEPVAQ